MQTYEISLDMKKAPGRIERTVTVRRGDNDTQRVEASITAGGQPYEPNGTARLDILHADGTWARCSASVSGSTAACTLPSEALNGTGRCRAAHFVFTDGAKVESTEGFALVIEGNVDVNGTPGAQGYDSELEALKDAWRKFTERAERDEAARAEAEGRRAAAETGRESAETARADAETKRAAAEGERAKAEQARATAETARGTAEGERVKAEQARATAEQGRAAAETARAEAESERALAEQSRASEESKRAAAETERKKAEDGRKSAEAARASEESKRAGAEDSRRQAETARASAENAREQAETARADAETGRAGAEAMRAQAESSRAEAEAARSAAEQGRASKEAERVEAERARADAQAKNNADQALNNEAMKKLSPVILQAGQYDPSTLTPNVTGEPNRVYFVPMVAPAAIELYDLTAKQVEAGNLYVEWMWVGGKWEQMGQSEMKAKPITTDQVDAVFAGTHPTGDSVLNLTGLDYVRTKDAELLDGKADASHTHTAGDIASGTLDPARVPVLPTAKVDGLQAALDGKQPKGEYAASSHTHEVAEVTGLQAALDGKAAAAHKHPTADVDGLQAALDGKAAAAHKHPTADVDGLQAALDGKQPKGEYAASSHTHEVAEVTGLQAALDEKWNKGDTIPPGSVYLLEDKLGDLDSRLGAVERGGGLRILYEETKTISYEGDGRLSVDLRFSAYANNDQGRFVCAVLDVPRLVSNINQVHSLPEPVVSFNGSGAEISVDGACMISPAYPYGTGEFWVRLTVYGYKA